MQYIYKGLLLLLLLAPIFWGSMFFVDIEERKIKSFSGIADFKKKVKILIVPGHDNVNFGAGFGDIREADLNAEIGEHLVSFLKENEDFDVRLARNNYGFFPEFARLFVNQRNDIEVFYQEKEAKMQELLSAGEVERVAGMQHNEASDEVSIQLFGINYWANQKKIDLIIHIHVNDMPRSNLREKGKYNGFSIYVPERQFANSKKSIEIAENIFDKLSKYVAVSSHPLEKKGIIEDQDLIAIGASHTLGGRTASLLMEYGYIYETRFTDERVRDKTLLEMANLTAKGINKYYGNQYESEMFDSVHVPMIFEENLYYGSNNVKKVLALQSSLSAINLYPAPPRTKNGCTINGSYGPCTEESVRLFQKLYGLRETGNLNTETRQMLNLLFYTESL